MVDIALYFFLQIADLMFFYRFFVVVINSCILYKT
jgi:hypothetical protein